MSLDFNWIGDPIVVASGEKLLTAKPKYFYEKCMYENTEYRVGDDVLISNVESADPESPEDCSVATILHLYEIKHIKSKRVDPFRAVVQWYSRVGQLTKRLRETAKIDPPLNEKTEVIYEDQLYEGDISIMSIFGKCTIVRCADGEIPRSPSKTKSKIPVYFCRFALQSKHKKQLVPLNQCIQQAPNIGTPLKTDDQLSPKTPDKTTPLAKRNIKLPSRYHDDVLPSPLKNATFSVQKSSELIVVIKKCNVSPTQVIKLNENENASGKKSAKKKLNMDECVDDENQNQTPQKKKRSGSAVKSSSKKRLKLTPSISSRSKSITETCAPLSEVRRRLHVSAVPQSLPCREDEFQTIFNFVEGKLSEGSSGCMYISGVPGTGKSATVAEVVRLLKENQSEGDLPEFKLIEINGMKLTTPHQMYVQIWFQLTGNKVSADKAVKLLQTKFSSNGPRQLPTVLIVDELDLLWTKQQDVLYNIFEWPNRAKAQLTVLAIANTMDLPERLCMNRVASRMGLTRLTFQPYKVKQLQTIISSRLEELIAFEPEAIEFIARKVSAASGDARRALDISRRAAELAERGQQNNTKKSPSKRGNAVKGTVTMQHVNAAIEEMFLSPKLLAIQACSIQEQTFLHAIVQEYNRTGVEETILQKVIQQHYTLCDLEGFSRPTVSELLSICATLNSCRLILSEHGRNDIRQKVRLNISVDDVTYALKDQ